MRWMAFRQSRSVALFVLEIPRMQLDQIKSPGRAGSRIQHGLGGDQNRGSAVVIEVDDTQAAQ